VGDPHDWPAEDLREILVVASARAGTLLTAGERVVVDRIARLRGEPARLYARLSSRKPRCFRLRDLDCPGVEAMDAAVAVLVREELADHLVPWPLRAAHLRVSDLKAALRALKLPVQGRRSELVARLSTHASWSADRWLRIRHRRLLARLERWYFLRTHRDRSTLVVERLGHVRWPTYETTTGPPLFRDRRAMLRWESLQRSDLSIDEARQGLREGSHRAPGGLDLGRRLRRQVVEGARALEASNPAAAREMYLELSDGSRQRVELAPRVARTYEHEGRPGEALAYLEQVRDLADGAERLAVHRAGRRIARVLRRGWAPDRPLRQPMRRQLRLPLGAGSGPRPHYRVGDRDLTVERAVCAVLSGQGRRALHVEGALWSTLFALLFADCFFLKVPGALPTRTLSGPLDLGTPRFRERRADAVAAVLDAVRAGQAALRVREADARYRGQRLSGAHWDIADGSTLAAIAQGIGEAALREILTRILVEGRRATRGLPDLVVLPGPECELPDTFPRRLGPPLLLVEVKGPGDTLRDPQTVWLDRLVRSGAHVELWEVDRSTVV